MKIPAVGVIILGAGIFLLMNLLTPNFTDDYAYAFIWDGAHDGNFRNDIGDLQRVQSFSDILYSQWSHYFTWGGRTIAHIFAQFFSWQGKLLFDFANAICFGILAWIIYILGAGKFEPDAKILIWIFFAMWFCLPEFFQTTLWQTGACNYLWMAIFQFGFLIPYVLKFWQKDFLSEFPRGRIILMAALGILAGWSNEAGGAFIILVAFLFLLYFRRQNQLERWMVAGFLGLFLGYALLMLAPGNFYRNEIDGDVGVPLSVMLYENFDEGFLPTILGDLILFLPIAGYFLRGKKSIKISQFILIFTAAGIFLPCLLMISPYFPARAAFASPIFLMVASIVALENFSLKLPKKLIYAAGIFWAATIIYALSVDWSVHSQIAARHEYILQHKNDEVIVVAPIILPASTEKIFWTWTADEVARFYNDLTPYERINRNKTYAKFFGVKKLLADEKQWLERPQFPLYDN